MSVSEVLGSRRDVTHAVFCFAEARLDVCRAEPARTYEVNVRSTRRVLEELIDLGIKPVFLSSDCVFDGEKGGYCEEDSRRPITVYGSHKLEVEDYLKGKPGLVLRLPKIFGTEPDDGTILSKWIPEILRGGEIRCAIDQRFSPLHIEDLIRAIQIAVERDLSGEFHVANPSHYSWFQLCETLLRTMRVSRPVVACRIRDFGLLENRPLNLSMNPAKFMAATGFSPRTVEDCCLELVQRVHSLS